MHSLETIKAQNARAVRIAKYERDERRRVKDLLKIASSEVHNLREDYTREKEILTLTFTDGTKCVIKAVSPCDNAHLNIDK